MKNARHRKKTVFAAAALAGALLIFTPDVAIAQTAPVNADFVSGIWYSQNQFFAGDNIRVYATFQNNSGFDLIGKIQFYDGEKLISETNFESIAGQLIQKWADWKVEAGNHDIKVKIVDTKKSLPGQTPEPIELPLSTQTITDTKEIKNNPDQLATDEKKLIETIKDETAIEDITQKISEVFKTTSTAKLNQPAKSFIPTSITDKISFITGPTNTGVIGQVVAVLEEKRDEADKLIQSGEVSEPIFWNTLNKLSEKYPQIEGAAKALPSSAQIQYRALAILAFILKTPLVLGITGLALLVLLWKLTKIFA